MAKSEPIIELTLNRRYNYGNFNHKDITIKLSGTEEQIDEQFQAKREKLLAYLTDIEEIVELAHEANALKKRIAPVGEKKAE